jgi:glycosyltransferase involved in cell wall biosynthesis
MSDGSPKWRRLLRIFSHGFATYSSGLKLLKQPLPDVIFVPTVLVHHLVGWLPLIKWHFKSSNCRVLLFFPNAPIDLKRDGTPYVLPDPTARLFILLISLLAKDVASGKVILAAETNAMVKALSCLTGVKFQYLPHPVDAGSMPLPEVRDPSASEISSNIPIVFGCYGEARFEKGSDVLQHAIHKVLEEQPNLPIRFVFQWGKDFMGDHGNIVTLDRWLRDHPKVDVLQSYVTAEDYEQLLRTTDVLLLPYRSPYRLRVSRVVIEAIVRGIPTVVTQGTTLFEQANDFSGAKGCLDGSARDLAKQIVAALNDYSSLSLLARSKAQPSREHFSVSFFRQQLIQYMS